MGVGAKRLPLPKISDTYPTMMKHGTVIPYLRRSKKYLNHVTQTPLSSADISIFSPEISKFCYIKKHRYRLHFNAWFLILLTFLESFLENFFNKHGYNFDDVRKMSVFWNKGYDLIIPAHGVTNKILSRDSNYIVNVAMWSKFGNSSVFVREVFITSIL